MSKYPEIASLENISQIPASVQAPHQISEIFWSKAITGYLDKKLNISNIFFNEIDRCHDIVFIYACIFLFYLKLYCVKQKPCLKIHVITNFTEFSHDYKI